MTTPTSLGAHRQAGPERPGAAGSTAAGDRWIVTGLLAVLLAVVGAMGALARYKSAPGEQGAAPPFWPASSAIARLPGLPTLLMFVHPMCPCTRASYAELRAVMSEFEGRVLARVVFALPTGVGDEWYSGDSWRAAASIPGVELHPDPGEAEARLFGASTSGHVLLYGDGGELLFQGGITAGRGHEGANAGRARLVALLRDRSAPSAAGPVFGCPLDHPTGERGP